MSLIHKNSAGKNVYLQIQCDYVHESFSIYKINWVGQVKGLSLTATYYHHICIFSVYK